MVTFYALLHHASAAHSTEQDADIESTAWLGALVHHLRRCSQQDTLEVDEARQRCQPVQIAVLQLWCVCERQLMQSATCTQQHFTQPYVNTLHQSVRSQLYAFCLPSVEFQLVQMLPACSKRSAYASLQPIRCLWTRQGTRDKADL